MSAPILILGMHRSGTSCLAGCLQAGGLVLGRVNEAAPHNARGNREHEPIRDVHERLMRYHGYTWDRPPPRQLDWRELDLAALNREAALFSDAPMWGVKDPRTIFCVKGWNELYQPRFIATFRHPLAVAASLMRRAEAWKTAMPIEQAISLWSAYNAELLNLTKNTDTVFLRYDVAPAQYSKAVKRVADQYGLDGAAAIEFYSETLVHETDIEDQVPPECETIWSQLLERAS